MTITLKIDNFDALPDGGPLVLSGAGPRLRDRPRASRLDACPTRTCSSPAAIARCASRKGGYWLYDVSRNGTFVNGSRAADEEPPPLANGDRLQIGHYLVSVSIDDAERAPARPMRARRSPPAGKRDDIWDTGATGAAADQPARAHAAAKRKGQRSADFAERHLELPPRQPAGQRRATPSTISAAPAARSRPVRGPIPLAGDRRSAASRPAATRRSPPPMPAAAARHAARALAVRERRRSLRAPGLPAAPAARAAAAAAPDGAARSGGGRRRPGGRRGDPARRSRPAPAFRRSIFLQRDPSDVAAEIGAGAAHRRRGAGAPAQGARRRQADGQERQPHDDQRGRQQPAEIRAARRRGARDHVRRAAPAISTPSTASTRPSRTSRRTNSRPMPPCRRRCRGCSRTCRRRRSRRRSRARPSAPRRAAPGRHSWRPGRPRRSRTKTACSTSSCLFQRRLRQGLEAEVIPMGRRAIALPPCRRAAVRRAA